MAEPTDKTRREPGRRAIPIAIAGLGAIALAAAVIAQSPSGPARSSASSSAPVAKPGPVASTIVGVNLYTIASWAPERAFANVANVDPFKVKLPGWPKLEDRFLDAKGWPTSLPANVGAPRGLIAPFDVSKKMRCTWTGNGAVSVAGSTRPLGGGRNSLEYLHAPEKGGGAHIIIDRTDPANPVRDVDCREADLPRDVLYTSEFVESVKPFGIVRFMEWQRTNANEGGRWAQRTLPDSARQTGPDGVAIEHMVALSNRTGSAPWFAMPYNADDEYIERFARLVHETLDKRLPVYVELGNEIWNQGFHAAKQAAAEGLRMRLSADKGEAHMWRYAQKSKNALAIWTKVFADAPERLVRVVSTQHVWTGTAELVLGRKDLLPYVDALATGAYFYADLHKEPTDDATLFRRINEGITKTISQALENKAIARRYGKRYIAYEAGSHVTTGDVSRNAQLIAMNRDPRMGEAYARYLREWRGKIGDAVVLYALTSTYGNTGSWGLRERSGQPLAEAPKLRAVRTFIDTLGPKQAAAGGS